MDFQPNPLLSTTFQAGLHPCRSRPLFKKIKNTLKEDAKNTPQRELLTLEEASHRNKKIQCPKETAVYSEVNGEKHYIHGNEIGNYILTQAPQQQAVPTFWKICLDNSQLIVDLTNHDLEFVDEYSPNKAGKTITHGKISITCLEVENDLKSQTAIYKLKITEADTGKEKVIHRLNYYGWQDGSQTAPQTLSKLIEKVDSLSGDQKVIVHCRIGVGRTGTFVTAREINKLIETKKIFDPDSLINETCRIILAGRQARNRLFVQNGKQLHSIFEFGRWRMEGDQSEQEWTPGIPSTDFLSPPPVSTPRDESICSEATGVLSQQNCNSTSSVP